MIIMLTLLTVDFDDQPVIRFSRFIRIQNI